MKRASQLWLLAPHLISIACFAGAFGWMMTVGTNRSIADLNLAIAGFVALLVALATSIAWVIVVLSRGSQRQWPWLLAHLGGLALVLVLAFRWLGAHLV